MATYQLIVAPDRWTEIVTALALARSADSVGDLLWVCFTNSLGAGDPLLAVSGPFAIGP